MSLIPTFETERLILRPHRLEDFDSCVELNKDEGVMRFITGSPSTRQETWIRMLRWTGMWHHLGYGMLVVEEKETGRFVGELGFLEMRRDMKPSIEGTLEAGWVLHPSVHGRGYATEALTTLIAWAEKEFPGKAMSCIIHPDNAPSLRVAAKLGFRETARTFCNGDVVLLMREECRRQHDATIDCAGEMKSPRRRWFIVRLPRGHQPASSLERAEKRACASPTGSGNGVNGRMPSNRSALRWSRPR